MIYQINPLCDQRWELFVQRHPSSSIFHTSGWLEALRRTYGYEPVAYTTSPPQGELTNGLVFCRLSSWLTGKRLISLPFSDHCDPLLEKGNSGAVLFEESCRDQSKQHLKYVEIRPRYQFSGLRPRMGPSETYCLHTIELSPRMGKLFSGFHESYTKRKIKRAEREKMSCRRGCSYDVLKMSYRPVLMTRKKHQVPPQPFAWFRNLAECLGPVMQIRLAMVGETPVAGIVALRFRNALLVKYAASDPRLRNLGGNQWLFWKAIEEAKNLGLQKLDLGRSDWDNPGLIAFKDRLGGKRFSICYWRYPREAIQPYALGLLMRPAGWVIGHMPLSMEALAGRTLYRHCTARTSFQIPSEKAYKGTERMFLRPSWCIQRAEISADTDPPDLNSITNICG